ncbi:MAG: hypothetical protein ACRBFS_00125 [Aureispira sp.]
MRIIGVVLFLLTSYLAHAQYEELEKNYWENMTKVTLKNKYDPKTENFTRIPKFGKDILALDGQKVYLKGFIIPADLTKGRMTLSKFSYSACYFCGAAGPESVIEVVAKNPIIYRMDKAIILEGTLRINRKKEGQEYDPFRLLYILEDATYYSGE